MALEPVLESLQERLQGLVLFLAQVCSTDDLVVDVVRVPQQVL
jgi:hypothetical protein